MLLLAIRTEVGLGVDDAEGDPRSRLSARRQLGRVLALCRRSEPDVEPPTDLLAVHGAEPRPILNSMSHVMARSATWGDATPTMLALADL